MADAELVIKIPSEVYENIKSATADDNDISSLLLGIHEATPLPKGHGGIVDIDKLIDSKCNECGHIRGVSCTIPCYAVRRMLDAPTIIGADKENY